MSVDSLPVFRGFRMFSAALFGVRLFLSLISAPVGALRRWAKLAALAWAMGTCSSAVWAVQVTTPTLSLPAGQYVGTQEVVIYCDTVGAELRYTLGGNEPTQSSPWVGSGERLILDHGTTLRVKAFKLNMTPSEEVSAQYLIAKLGIGNGYVSTSKADGTFWRWGGGAIRPFQLTQWTPKVLDVVSDQVTYLVLEDGSVKRLSELSLTGGAGSTPYSGLTEITAVAVGNQHQLALKRDGTVLAWGSNNFGQTGLIEGTVPGAGNSISSPTLVPKLSGVVAIAACNNSSYAICKNATDNYSVWAWGENTEGAVGDGTVVTRWTPFKLPNLSKIKQVAAGWNYCLALTDDGSVWAWGMNDFGNIGDNTKVDKKTPIQVPGLSGIKSISAGKSSMAIGQNGQVWIWGEGVLMPTVMPEMAGASGVISAPHATLKVALMPDGAVRTWGVYASQFLGDGSSDDYQELTPRQVFALEQVAQVASSTTFNAVPHTVALLKDGTVWTWGGNNAGQLGRGNISDNMRPTKVPTLSGVIWVAAGNQVSFAVKSDGTVWSWGYNTDGALGDGTTVSKNVPVQVGVGVTGFSGIVEVSADAQVLARKSDGTLWVWGSNYFSTLGDGLSANVLKPKKLTLTAVTAIAAASRRSYAIAGGRVYRWGSATDDLPSSGVPIIFAALDGRGVISLAASTTHTLGLTSTGLIYGVENWAGAAQGGLGNGTQRSNATTPVLVSSSTGLDAALKISAGYGISTAIRNSDRSVWVWGDPSVYEGNAVVTFPEKVTTATGLGAVTAISAGDSRYVVSVDGTVWAWGYNHYNHLATRLLGAAIPYTLARIRLIADWDDTDSDGFKDSWEMLYFGNLIHDGVGYNYTGDVGLDGDMDGLDDIHEFILGTNPNSANSDGDKWGDAADPFSSDPYDHRTIDMKVISGAGQSSVPGQYLAQPLIVRLTYSGDSAATAFVNVPVTFSVDGSGKVSESLGSPLQSSIVLKTNVSGEATIYFKRGVEGAFTVETSTVGQMARLVFKEFNPLQVEAPVLKPIGNTAATAFDLTIASATTGSSIWYTTDGSDPAENRGINLNAPFRLNINSDLQIRAVAVKAGLEPSSIIEESFLITGAIVAGESHSVALKSDGTVWVWGDNFYGQLGDPTLSTGLATSLLDAPKMIALAGVTAIAAGDTHTLAVKGGLVYSWGNDASGQLGSLTNTAIRKSPVLVNEGFPVLSDVNGPYLVDPVIEVAGGASHSLAVTAGGAVWAWGANAKGQLGDNSIIISQIPKLVVGLPKIVAVDGGDAHTLALSETGFVYAWGSDSNGQLGNDSTIADKKVPVLVAGLSDIIAIACGANHSLALARDGTVWAWGYNLNQQLGRGQGNVTQSALPLQVAGLTGIAEIGAGNQHSLAVDREGRVYAWGDDALFQTGDGDAALTDHGVPALVFTQLKDVYQVAAGGNHTLALKWDGYVGAWGSDAKGQLGNGATTGNQAAFVSSNALRLKIPNVATPVLNSNELRIVSGDQQSSAPGVVLQPLTVATATPVGTTITYRVVAGAGTLATVDGTRSGLKEISVSSNAGTGEAAVVFTQSSQLGAVSKIEAFSGILNSFKPVTFTARTILAVPTISPAAGTYAVAQVVLASHPTPGVMIHYTLDGTAPTQSSPKVLSGGGIRIARTSTLKLIALHPEFPVSTVVSASFTITGTGWNLEDDDRDGLSNSAEVTAGTKTYLIDSDGDGMSDAYEVAHGLNPNVNDLTGDFDLDTIPNREDARPKDAAIGRLNISITKPANGATY